MTTGPKVPLSDEEVCGGRFSPNGEPGGNLECARPREHACHDIKQRVAGPPPLPRYAHHHFVPRSEVLHNERRRDEQTPQRLNDRIAELESKLADVLSMSTCTRCGLHAVPTTYPVGGGHEPLKLVYRCPNEDCGYRVPPPMSAKIEALETKLREAVAVADGTQTYVGHLSAGSETDVDCWAPIRPCTCGLDALLDRFAALQSAQKEPSADSEKRRPDEAARFCNRHDDCAEAEVAYLSRHPDAALPILDFHCYDDCCEDCFGK